MEIDEKEKIYIYFVITIVILILIAVIVIIWTPNKKSALESQINKNTENMDYEITQKEKYTRILNRLLITSNFEQLYEKLDQKWLDKNTFSSKDEVKKYLVDNFYITNTSININNIEVLTTDNACVFKYNINNNGKNVNVIVNEYLPYQYAISFDQEEISILSGKSYKYNVDDVCYEINTLYAGNNVVQYELIIKNNSDNTYVWNFDNTSDIVLYLLDGTGMGCSDATSFATNILTLKKDGVISIKLTFNISFKNQSDINEIAFFNVLKNNEKYEIRIPLNGGE